MSHLYTHGLIIAKALSPQKPRHDLLIDQIQPSEAEVSTTNTNALYLILICRQHQILKTMPEIRHTNQKRPQFYLRKTAQGLSMAMAMALRQYAKPKKKRCLQRRKRK